MQSSIQKSTSKSAQKNKPSVVKLVNFENPKRLLNCKIRTIKKKKKLLFFFSLSLLYQTPSQLVQKQLSGNILEDFHQKPKITKFLNLADYSIYTETNVPIDEPLFEAIPPLIQFTDYEPLQLKQKIFKLRNKDKCARRVKILPPDSRLFQVMPAPSNTVKRRPSKNTQQGDNEEFDQLYAGNKVAPGMEANFYIKFSPEAKIDYYYDLTVVTEREQFVVPIYAVGKRAMIDFPDTLDFGTCPVKYITEKPVIIRNLGEKTTKWFLKLPQGFDADKKEGVLEYGRNEQIVIHFYPHEAKTYKSETILQYDNLQAYVPIMGIAHNSQMDDAYIGLQTQQTLQIINKSVVKVDFEWRAFATEKEEQEKKNRLRAQLEEEEAEERMLLKEIVNNEAIHEEFEIEDHDDSDEEDKDEKAVLLKRQRKAELMLARKYKNIRKAIEDDLLLFQDDIFSIEPQQGQIWPNSEMTITITFVPKGALHYSCLSFCNISCSEERLPLNLAGEGIGPKAFLSQSDLPIGNKNVNEKETYEITIENRGEIECRFELLPNERNFGKMFKFLETRGVLGVGTRMAIPIEFQSTIPGEFKETFRFRLEGSTELLSLTCFGHVTAPKFSFDTDQINFGKVPFSFPVEKTITLTNQSNVSFWYNLRIPGDGKQTLHKEFEITPQRDCIDKNTSKTIVVTFIPKSCKKYEMVMVVDIEGVGQDMYSLPIKAESEVPQIEIKPKDTLDFGDIFLRDPDTRKITMINNSSLKGKFIVQPQNEESKILATYKVDVESDTIEPNKDATIQVTLMTMKLREITLPLSINIVGANNGLPYVINIVANSIGPRVEVMNMVKEIDFGTMEVLRDYSQKITIKNNSRIIADFHAFTKNKNSVFKPIEKKGVLQPDESKEIEIICCCDDANKFTDILHFVIKEGMDIDIMLKGKGVGSTIFCQQDLSKVSFGVCYTHRYLTDEIFVENKGRKDQKLTWVRKKPTEKRNEKDDKKDSKGQEIDPEPDVFKIVPDKVDLPKKHGVMFQFVGNSTRRGKIQETWMLNVSNQQERRNETLFNTVIEGEFIQPTLNFSDKKLYFKYTWEKNIPFMPISKNLDLICGSSLPVNFLLKVQPPFSINHENFELIPGKSAQVRVDFDPGQKLDRISGEQTGKITVVHQDHPHREYIDLIGEVCFPNIKLDSQLINFGSILNDTSKKIVINMKNISEMPIYYEWNFVEEELQQQNYGQESDKRSESSRASQRNDSKSIPINEVFDILPLSGYLNVNETEQVEFVYNAFGGQRFKTTAICHVEGGPKYEVTLIGDSSLLTYRLSTDHIELNEIRFCDWIARDFFIENTGKVTFEYKILYHAVKRKGYIDCSPSSGKILGGEKQKITLRICPVMPNEFKEVIMVQIGYFEPEPLTITGKGYYPSILMTLPRQENPEFSQKFEKEFEKKKLDRENTLKRQQLMAKAQGGDKKQQVGAGVKSVEQIQTEVEKELDRQFYCDMIDRTIEEKEREKLFQTSDKFDSQMQGEENPAMKKTSLPDVQLTRTMTAQSKQNFAVETKLYEKIFLISYILDFGNVVINKQVKKQYKVTNLSNQNIDFWFDTRICRQKGYQIVPERTTKLQPGEEQTITISYQANKNMKFGKTQTLLPLEVKNGAKYNIELLANITIPEIFLENIQDDLVDFQKVLCGQRKTVFLRLVNEKEIDCQWTLSQRGEMVQDKKKEPPRFQLEPSSGIIPPQQKQVIQITFFPYYEKEYHHKFVILIDQNPKPFPIQVKGTGTSINLQFDPYNCEIGPVLPYNQFATTLLSVYNPSEYHSELYSIDFDKKYIEEEETLDNFDDFDETGKIFLPVREVGAPLWDSVKKSVEKKKRRLQIQEQLDNEELEQEARQQLQNELFGLQQQEKKIDFPKRVEKEHLHHIIIWGMKGVGKTKLIQSLQDIHKRDIVNLSDVVEWCIERETVAGKQVQAYLQERQTEREAIDAERQKLLKKAGKKAADLEQKWGPIQENQFRYLKEELFVECLRERMDTESAGAGIMVEGLETEYLPNEMFGLKCLLQACGEESIQMVVVQPETDEAGLPIWKMIEWEGMLPKEDELLEKAKEQDESATKKTKKAAKKGEKVEKNVEKNAKKTTKKGKDITDKTSRGSGGQGDEEVLPENQIPLFEIFEPRDFENEEEKQEFELKYSQFKSMMLNQYKEKLEIPKIYDPVFDENKKEEKKGKKGKEVVEEVQEVVEEVIDYTDTCHRGARSFTPLPIHYNLQQLTKSALEIVAAPIYPDPNLMPVQEPIFHHIVQKPSSYVQRKSNEEIEKTLKYFSILTPKDLMYAEDIDQKNEEKLQKEREEQQKLNGEEPKEGEQPLEEQQQDLEQNQDKLDKTSKKTQKKQTKKLQRGQKKEDEKEEEEKKVQKYFFTEDQLRNDVSRWIIPPKKTLLLTLRFFTTTTGFFESGLNFEANFSLKKYQIQAKAQSDFPQISQLPKNIFWSVKKLRTENIQKVYISQEGLFEFGPLLIGKNPEKKNENDVRKINSTTFRISNHGKFDTSIEFALMSSVIENDPMYKKGIFLFEPERLDIKQNDVPQEVRVWAIPDEAKKFKDDLIVMIKDNPTPVILPLTCLGSRPQIEITQGDPIKFDRLLLGQKSKKEIKLKNTGNINAKWRLVGCENLPAEIQLENAPKYIDPPPNKRNSTMQLVSGFDPYKRSGELKPNEEAVIFMEFKAEKQQKYTHQISLEVEDTEDMAIKCDPKPISIEAEAFDISVDFKFPENNDDNMLTFGPVHVGDIKDQYFTVKNVGLYLVQLSFVMRKRQFRENFTVIPDKLELEQGQEKQILVRFSAESDFELRTQRDTTDLICEILEGKSLELFKQVPINVEVNSKFSVYSLTPIKQINFGPLQFSDQRTLTFDIKNEGLFEFQYWIFDYWNEELRKEIKQQQKDERKARRDAVLAADQAQGKDSKKAKKEEKKVDKKGKGKGKDADPATMLRLGQWAINPCNGAIAPGSSITVEVTFQGSGQRIYEQKLAIEISGRDPQDQDKGILYEVVGESCIPGIICDSYEQIFEEQVIVPSQASSATITPLISSNVFYYEEKMFNFGSIVPSLNPDGICEKFKIINPNKIPCSVKFDVRKRNPNSNENFAFEMATKNVKIPPHESTYVKVFFKPQIMALYSGIFEAIVEQGESNPKTSKLVFDLRGEGAMPTLKLEKPKEYTNDSTALLKFSKVRISKDATLPIMLKNDGQVPASVKWELTTNENFRFLDQNTLTLTPKTYATFNIEFKPREPGIKQWVIQYQTQLNPYEVTKIMVQGEGFYEDIVFEDLPNEMEDEINLGDCILNQEKRLTFAIKNNSTENYKFNWNAQGCEDFTMIPRVGHLKAKASKSVTLIFKSKMSVNHKNFNLILETRQIKQNTADFVDWDDSMFNIRYVTTSELEWYERKREEERQRILEEEKAGQNKKGAKKQDKKAGKKDEKGADDKPPAPQPGEDANRPLQEPILEPDHSVIDKTEKNYNLKINAVADYARYEISTKEIFFKNTLMYTSRTYQFTLKNTSLINMHYKCRIIQYDEETGQPNVDPGYFYINPKDGVLAPNCDETFTVRFSPTEVHQTNERFLIITIENMEPKSQPCVVELDGQAERPICHFELFDEMADKKVDIDSNFSLMNFQSLGTKVKNTKRFYVVNPTHSAYDFEWKKIDEDKLPPTANYQYENFFKCLTQKGTCLSGKKFEMVFEYVPDQVGLHEAYWSFNVEAHKITQNFQLIGQVNEPNVFFDTGKVNFGPLLIGGKNKEIVKLKNVEDVPISFNFEKSSILGEGEYGSSLQVSPISGTIKGNGELPVEITFQPQIETSYNYNLLCNLKRKSRPISLNIKGIGYILDHSVYFGHMANSPLDSTVHNVIDFGDIYINEKRQRVIEIENKGDFNFDFTLKKSAAIQYLQVASETGTVKSHSRFKIELNFTPTDEMKFSKKLQLILSITSGPTYIFKIQGSAKKPQIELSFYNHDFGNCFVLRQPLSVTTYLEMRNRDTAAMSVETLFEKKSYLNVQLAPGTVIMPLQIESIKDPKRGTVTTNELNVLRIPITFTPRECIKYNETVTLDINNLYKIDLKIQGEGVPFKVELEKTEDQNIDFGVVRVGKESFRQCTLVNLSKKPVTLTFDVDDQLENLKKNFINIHPFSDFVINPRERKEVELIFSPKLRLHAFKKEIMFKIIENQEVRKLLNVHGNCHGMELKLMEDTIGFGVVTINSKKTKQLQLSNLGDIGAKFEWETTFCGRYFNIQPQKGFLPPNEDTFFQITFQPDVVDKNDYCFNNVKCNIQGSDPLSITLLGKCVDYPKESLQELKFETMVRSEQKKKVTIKNPTAEAQKIKVSINSTLPKFQGYFKGKEWLELQPNANVEYEICYSPLTMTANDKIPEIVDQTHEGTLFFPLPDGSAILYNLVGVSTIPSPESQIDVTLKAKTQHISIIPIKNWLKELQRLTVTWEQEAQDQSIFITGAKTIDIASEATKDYKLSIYGLKTANSMLNVYFKNEKTHEFKHFKLKISITPPDQQKKIELTSIVRETVSKIITIENPLSTNVEIKKENLISDNENISFNPNTFTIPNNSEFGFELIYRPLLVKEETSKVTLKSPDLGEFVYPLSLKGLPSTSVQKTMSFKCGLGSDIIQSFKFQNFCKKQTTYTCRIEKLGSKSSQPQVDAKGKPIPIQTDFSTDVATIQAPPTDLLEGNEISMNIKFEPSNLSETQNILILTSPEGGEYSCILSGVGYAPQPKGPFKLGGQKPAPIEFKNPFWEAQEFIIRIDNASFTTGVKSPVKVDAKKVLSIGIGYKAVPGQSTTGRLIISIDKSDYPPWVFYLQGE